MGAVIHVLYLTGTISLDPCKVSAVYVIRLLSLVCKYRSGDSAWLNGALEFTEFTGLELTPRILEPRLGLSPHAEACLQGGEAQN